MRHPDHRCGPLRRARIQPWKPALVAAAGMMLGACTVGPDFHSPASATARHYQVTVPKKSTDASAGPAGAAQSFTVGQPIEADWYTLFQSPRLNALIRQALTNNPSIAASQASLREAAHQLEAVSGSNFPNVAASLGASRQRANGARLGQSNPLFNNVFNLYQAKVSLSYDLDLFGATRRATEAQEARVAYAQDVLRGSMLALVDNVVVTTVRYAALRDQLAAMERIIQAEQNQVGLLNKQETAGSVAYADVLRARAQLADTRARIPPLRHNLATTEHALAQLVGADPGRFQAPKLSLSDFTLPRDLPVSLSSNLVRQRPDILAAQRMMHAANAEIGVATAHLYPDINLSADLGSIANHPGDLFKSPSKVWSVGGSLLAPLFEGGTLRANRKVAKAAWEASYAKYKETVLRAFTQVADVLDAIQQDAATLKAQNQALQANRDSLQLVRKQYQAGAASYIDVLVAEQRYDQALVSHIDAASQRFVDTASLYHALGGGWWNAPAKQSNPDPAKAPAAKNDRDNR